MDKVDDRNPLDLRLEPKRFVSRGVPRNLSHVPHKTISKRFSIMIPHPRPLIDVAAPNLALQLILPISLYRTGYMSGFVEQTCSER